MERRLIDANALPYRVVNIVKTGSVTQTSAVFSTDIAKAPTIDAVEVVRCRECKRHRKEGCIDMVWCGKWGSQRLPDDYCSYGERREPDGE